MYLSIGTIEEQLIKNRLQTYNKVTDVSCILISNDGETLCSEGQFFQCCAKFQQLRGDKNSCNDAHLKASKQSQNLGEPYVFFCPSGLVHWAVPIVVKGIFRGGLIGGPVQMEMSEDYIVDEVIRINNFNVSERGLLRDYIKNVPIIEPEKVRYLADMLYMVARDIMEEEIRELEDRKKFYEVQAAISENIQSLKVKADLEHITQYYPLELEKELVAKVKMGNKLGARAILNELLSHVLFASGSSFEVTKARVLELTTVLSRAAVEGGSNLECIFGLNLNYIQEISTVMSVEELCKWIVKVLDRFIDSKFIVENNNNSNVIQSAIIYINENMMNDIALDDVSEYVYLSPAYFSRLFKKEMGINFKDYLNKVKIEESKKFLTNLKLSMTEIAHSVGFADQSYYAKVFKKVEGISPGQYKKMINH